MINNLPATVAAEQASLIGVLEMNFTRTAGAREQTFFYWELVK